MLHRIGEYWSGWSIAAGNAARRAEKADDWQSSVGLTAGLCSEKCGCVGDGCPASGVLGLDQPGGDGAPEGESWSTPSARVAEPVHSDAGMSTVEYAVGTVVAAAFAAVLYKIVTGDSVVAGLTNLINSALSTSF